VGASLCDSMFRRRLFSVALLYAACGSHAAAAPQFTCYTVHRGDTAARIAYRLTRDAGNAYAPWFQILDPASSTFVPKSQYGRIRPGWQACIAERAPGPFPPAAPSAIEAAPPVARSAIQRFWWAPMLFFATALAWIGAQKYLDRRETVARALEQFGKSFVREFERPLLQQSGAESPIQSRLRILPERDWLEVLIAPNKGWHYPNLTDHRRNLEYDVERIVTLLGERRLICGQLGARGPWVVIPFRLVTRLKKEERT
jgi:hypothetical protein